MSSFTVSSQHGQQNQNQQQQQGSSSTPHAPSLLLGDPNTHHQNSSNSSSPSQQHQQHQQNQQPQYFIQTPNGFQPVHFVQTSTSSGPNQQQQQQNQNQNNSHNNNNIVFAQGLPPHLQFQHMTGNATSSGCSAHPCLNHTPLGTFDHLYQNNNQQPQKAPTNQFHPGGRSSAPSTPMQSSNFGNLGVVSHHNQHSGNNNNNNMPAFNNIQLQNSNSSSSNNNNNGGIQAFFSLMGNNNNNQNQQQVFYQQSNNNTNGQQQQQVVFMNNNNQNNNNNMIMMQQQPQMMMMTPNQQQHQPQQNFVYVNNNNNNMFIPQQQNQQQFFQQQPTMMTMPQYQQNQQNNFNNNNRFQQHQNNNIQTNRSSNNSNNNMNAKRNTTTTSNVGNYLHNSSNNTSSPSTNGPSNSLQHLLRMDGKVEPCDHNEIVISSGEYQVTPYSAPALAMSAQSLLRPVTERFVVTGTASCTGNCMNLKVAPCGGGNSNSSGGAAAAAASTNNNLTGSGSGQATNAAIVKTAIENSASAASTESKTEDNATPSKSTSNPALLLNQQDIDWLKLVPKGDLQKRLENNNMGEASNADSTNNLGVGVLNSDVGNKSDRGGLGGEDDDDDQEGEDVVGKLTGNDTSSDENQEKKNMTVEEIVAAAQKQQQKVAEEQKNQQVGNNTNNSISSSLQNSREHELQPSIPASIVLVNNLHQGNSTNNTSGNGTGAKTVILLAPSTTTHPASGIPVTKFNLPITLHRFHYDNRTPIYGPVVAGKFRTRPPDIKLGGICGEAPVNVIANMISFLGGVRVVAVDMFLPHLGRCAMWLEPVTIEARERVKKVLHSRVWMGPLEEGIGYYAQSDEEEAYLTSYLEKLKASALNRAARFPRHMMTVGDWN